MTAVTRSRSRLPTIASSQAMSPNETSADYATNGQAQGELPQNNPGRLPARGPRLAEERQNDRPALAEGGRNAVLMPVVNQQEGPDHTGISGVHPAGSAPSRRTPNTGRQGDLDSVQDATALTNLRELLATAYDTYGARQVLATLLDQVGHRGDVPVTAGSARADDEEIPSRPVYPDYHGSSHASIGVRNGTGGSALSASQTQIRPRAATANGSGALSPPPSSESSASSGPAREPPTYTNDESRDEPLTSTSERDRAESWSLLVAAKNRAMLSREIKVLELDGHKKYDAWKQDLRLKLNEWGLMTFLDANVKLDNARAAIDPEYAFLFNERRTKSFSALALSLSTKLREEFKGPIETQDPAALFSALKAHFERGKENPIYLKREFYSKTLAKGESVQQYIDGLRDIRRRIAESGDAITENELARTIVSNCVDVYPTKINTGVDLDVQQAVIQLETAEQAQREVSRSGGAGQPRGQGLQDQRRVTAITGPTGTGNKKRGARGKMPKKSKKPRVQPGPDNRCLNCNSSDHWYSNCPKELTEELQKKKEAYLAHKNRHVTKMPPSLVSVVLCDAGCTHENSSRAKIGAISQPQVAVGAFTGAVDKSL